MRCVTFEMTLVVVLGLASMLAAQDAKEGYDAFNRFCIENFGAEKEPLVYAFAGKDLKFLDEPFDKLRAPSKAEGGAWTYASETSAAVGFETNLPANASVEYGETAAYGKRTGDEERPFYLHLAYLTGLKRDTLYHYRLIATDERGNRVASADMTLTTKTPANVVRIPDDLEGPPFVLNKADTTYLVTKDLTVDGTAFDVNAKNVTLDLDGHTVVYDQKAWGPVLDANTGKPDGNFWGWINHAKYGLRAMRSPGLKVLNGTIRQGAGNDASQGNSIGFNPMYINGGSGMEIAGVTLVYSGPQQVGIYAHWGGNDSEFHHNVFLDLGTAIVNRHGAGSRAILFYGSPNTTGIRTHHNLVKRTRQGGVGGNEVWRNEVWMDSWATNSFGLGVSSGGKVYENRVLGGGYHVCAMGWGSKITGRRNFVQLKAFPFPEKRWPEYGQYASNNALRLTQYSGSKNPYEDNVYEDNLFIIHDAGGRQVRGVQIFSDPYVKNYVLRSTTVKVMSDDAKTTNAACVVTQGNSSRTDEMLPVYYRDCTFISNICNVKFGDDYGTGSNHRFERCKFVKVGDRDDYHTLEFGSGYPSKNHVLLDCTFEGGASAESIGWLNGTSDHSFSVGWTLTLHVQAGVKVAITDAAGAEVYSGTADATGVLKVPLVEYVRTFAGKQMKTPHQITGTAPMHRGGVKNVTMDAAKEIRF